MSSSKPRRVCVGGCGTRLLDNFRSSVQPSGSGWSPCGPTPFGAVMLGLVASFVISCIEQFAQSHALQEDTVRLRREAERMQTQPIAPRPVQRHGLHRDHRYYRTLARRMYVSDVSQ